MSIGTWVETVPSGTSNVGAYPPFGRSVWTGISGALAVEHSWTGTGGGSEASAGDLLPGGSRAFAAAQSASSVPSQGTARLFFATNVNRLFAYDSAATLMVGTAAASEHASVTTNAYWARQTGSFTSNTSSGNTTISFAVPYLSAPVVAVSRGDAGTVPLLISPGASGGNNFTSVWSFLGTASAFTMYWDALGLVSSGSF